MEDITNELLTAILHAPPNRKKRALQVLLDQAAPPQLSGPFLLTMGKAASLLGVSRSTMYRLVVSGAIESVEIRRGTFRVRRADIEAYGQRGMHAEQGGAS